MERLTKRTEDEDTLLAEVGDTACKCFCDNYTLLGCWECPVGKAIEKLAGYEDLEEQQGFLIKLPCRPDDSVFIIVGKDISRQKIRKVTLEGDSILFETRGRKFGVGCFGDTVFTDRESAERRLKELWED